MKNLRNLLFAALLITVVSCNSNTKKNNNNSNSTDAATDSNEKELKAKDSTQVKADYEYAVKAANGGMLEVELGKLAQNKAISPDVMKFANMMVADHTKANTELKAIAASKFITLPAILDNKTQKDYDDFSKMKREEFDKAYTEYMIKDHKEDIEEFKKEANDGKDAELKAFATKHVPILQHHLQMAQQANDAVKNKK
jgi:putative membrane protein